MSYGRSRFSEFAFKKAVNGKRSFASFICHGSARSDTFTFSAVNPIRCTVTFPIFSTAGSVRSNRNVTMSNEYSSPRRSVISFIASSAPPTKGAYASEKTRTRFIRVLFLLFFQQLDVFAHGLLRLPAVFLFRARGVDDGFHTVTRPLRKHLYLSPEHLRDIQDRVRFGATEPVVFPVSALADQEKPARNITRIRKVPPLGPRCDDSDGLTFPVQLLESPDHRRVRSFRKFPRAVGIVKIRRRVGKVEPFAVIADQFRITRLHPRVRRLVAPQPAVGKLSACPGIDGPAPALPPIFEDLERARHIRLPYQFDILEALLHP